jgi:hypothetical protein
MDRKGILIVDDHPVTDALKLQSDLNRTKIDLIFTDLELAFTFAASAASSENPDTRNRNRANARKAYFQIRDKLLPLSSPDDSERAQIVWKLRELQRCLERLGEKTD